ncbi:uncharacterized protein LOC142356845, partial [Convolutriloba macropyga]|uniref:uncharacterized protein LOC142356845 n=1 Tax=Convolutriloba macropyga TaxID=536237 RepID=UPI003F51D911
MGEKSEKLAHFKGQELTVAEPSEGTLAHFIIQGSVQSAPDDKIAYVDITANRTVTFGEVRSKVYRLAHGLVQRGYKVGDVACIHCCNTPEFVIAQLAAGAAGMTVSLCNSLYSS